MTAPDEDVYELCCGHDSRGLCPECQVCGPCHVDSLIDLTDCEHGDDGEPPIVCRTCQVCLRCIRENAKP